jgi:hypothetical protein
MRWTDKLVTGSNACGDHRVALTLPVRANSPTVTGASCIGTANLAMANKLALTHPD